MAEGVNQLTVQDLYANHCEKLSLQWVTGQQGGKRSIVPEDNQDTDPNIVDDDLNDPCNINLSKNRTLSIINVRELFGDSAIKTNKYLRLIIHLEPLDRNNLIQIDRLEGSYRTQRVLDLDIPVITLPVAPGRNLAVLLECAARNHMLRLSGYNASDELSERQRILLELENR